MSTEERTFNPGCYAHYCPMLGSLTRDSGSGKWLCGMHFGAESDQWHAVTQELLRLKWLVDVTRNIRANAMDPHAWEKIEPGLHKEIMLAQRSDLQRGPREAVSTWLARLEGVLSTSCAAAATEQAVT